MRPLLLAIALLSPALLTGCGSEPTATDRSGVVAAEPGAFPATIEHKFGRRP